MAFDKIVGVDGTTYQFPTLVRTRIADNIKQVGSVENLATIDALGPALATKSDTTHNHTLASLTSNGIDELGDVEIGVVGSNGIALADKHTLQYEASTTKWRNKVASGGVTVSESRPTTPIPGDAWFDSNDGTLYVYYTDGNSAQWVQVQANSALEGTILARLDGVESRATALEGTPNYSPNYLINGGFDVWQRGTSFTSAGYNADRWASVGTDTTNNTISRSSSIVPSGALYSLSITKASTAGVAQIRQSVETINSVQLAGKTTTFSVSLYASSSTVVSLFIDSATGTDLGPGDAYTQLTTSDFTVTNSWTRSSVTVNVPADTKSIRVRVRTAILGVGATLHVSNAQLEEGSVATPFRRNANSIQGELAACQRYYYRINGGFAHYLSIARASSGTAAGALIPYKVPMRIVPTSFESSNLEIENPGVGNITVTGSYANFVTGTDLGGINIAGSGFSTSTMYWLRFSTTGHVAWSAEL
jgi:hypothetical protein